MLYFAGPLAWIGASIFLAILYPRTLKKREAEYARMEAEKSAIPEAAEVGEALQTQE